MARKKWGQNFLIHQSVVEEILLAANIQSNESVLEIGPGQGVLTRALLSKSKAVTAVEIDPDLCVHLKEHIWQPEFTLIEQDVLELDAESIANLLEAPAKVVANLPYNIATPLLLKMFSVRKAWKSFTIMVQLEVAQRLCAIPSSGKLYGPLSLVGSLGFECRIVIQIPPEAFRPAPKVESAVLHLTPRESGLTQELEQVFLKWSHRLFQQRRKTLVNGIKNQFPDWYQANVESLTLRLQQRRPETMELDEWLDLFQDYLNNVNK